MKAEPDITVTINFHHEGVLAVPALASLSDLLHIAADGAVAVETQAILDCADKLTRHIVEVHGGWIDKVHEVSFGDLGLSRNAGTNLAHGRFLSFLDGDDLWGEQWLHAAFQAATLSVTSQDAIWHPEHHYTFGDIDGTPEASTSIYQLFQATDTLRFDPAMLAFHTLWSANAFAIREIYLRFPYCAVDRSRGLGIEDWSWNWATLEGGVHHRIVPGAVHMIRRKRDSLMQQNTRAHFLPHMPPSFIWCQK